MSITVSTTIVCDGDDCIHYIYGAGGNRIEKARALRRAKAAGWVHHGSQDFCPVCVRKNSNPLPTYYKTTSNTLEVSGGHLIRQARSPEGYHTRAMDRAEVEVRNHAAVNRIKEEIASRDVNKVSGRNPDRPAQPERNVSGEGEADLEVST